MDNRGACHKTSFVQGPLPRMQGGQVPHPGVRYQPAMQSAGHEEYPRHRDGQRMHVMSGQQQQRLQNGPMQDHCQDGSPDTYMQNYSGPFAQANGDVVFRDGGLPTASEIRNNRQISDCVSQRLAELGLEEERLENNTELYRKQRGKKSGLQRTVEDQVVNEIDWPHLYIYRGQDKKPVHYADLTLAEFVFGYLSMVDNPRNDLDRPLMLSILRDMMLDTTQYGWYQVRNYYRILASGIEMARYSWSDSMQISSIRAQYAQRPNFQNQSRNSVRQNSSGQNNGIVKVCNSYQTDDCSLQDGHDGYLHVCAYCYNSTGMVFRHREKDCRRKLFSPKNGSKGGL